MGISKVNFGDETLMDLTGDTVTSNSLLSGATAHGADGEPIEGTVTVPTKTSQLDNDSGFITGYTAGNGIDIADGEIKLADDIIVNKSISLGRKSGESPGLCSFAQGNDTSATGSYSHAEGVGTKATVAQSHAEGYYTKAINNAAHSEGYQTEAGGWTSHAEGNGSKTVNGASASHAEGQETTAMGNGSHTEGNKTEVNYNGTYAHAEGDETKTNAKSSHVEGYKTEIQNPAEGSHAEGSNTLIMGTGKYAHAEGIGTIAAGEGQHVAGKYNVSDTTSLEIIGNGTSADERSNARTLDASGNETLAGKLTVGVGPVENMDVATKQYVDNATANIPTLPSFGDGLTSSGGTVSIDTSYVVQQVIAALPDAEEVSF